MNVIVCEVSEGIYTYPQLTDWVRNLGYDPDDESFDAFVLLEGDPDILKIHDWRTYFIDVDIDGTKYILTSDEVTDRIRKMLTPFHGPDNDKYYEAVENTWEAFEALPDAIAYRGGKGYYYGINAYKS